VSCRRDANSVKIESSWIQSPPWPGQKRVPTQLLHALDAYRTSQFWMVAIALFLRVGLDHRRPHLQVQTTEKQLRLWLGDGTHRRSHPPPGAASAMRLARPPGQPPGSRRLSLPDCRRLPRRRHLFASVGLRSTQHEQPLSALDVASDSSSHAASSPKRSRWLRLVLGPAAYIMFLVHAVGVGNEPCLQLLLAVIFWLALTMEDRDASALGRVRRALGNRCTE